ncbi:MAG TPA: TerC family protein [Saprospiraceae bacterium]|nr:TerC family protein [Saprospiraceae bacterium]HNM27167.1 TerC family protein [Saprospiraceae bacterium]
MLLLSMPDFTSGAVWISLLTLTFLEIVLGVDNIIFLSIVSSKLPAEQQPRARNIGLILAMLLRVVMLFGITWIMSWERVLIPLDFLTQYDDTHPGEHAGLTGQGLILLIGGLFLLWKATTEIHHKLESPNENDDPKVGGGKAAFNQVVMQIAVINIVFSFDSILTAVGIADNLWVMIIAVVLSVLIMMTFSGPVSKFVNQHPTVQMLGLAFLILIGFSLVAEAAHSGHVLAAEVPKGYLYFAIFFSLFVEMLNIRMRRKSQKPVQLHGPGEVAARRGLLDEDLLDDK